jgi:WD40 repeat protein
MESHRDGDYCLDFSPDGKIIIAEVNGRLSFVDRASRRRLAMSLAMELPVYPSLAWSPRGTIVAVGHGAIVLANLGTGETTPTVSTGDGELRALTFSPDGRFLASVAGENVLKLWSFSQDLQAIRPLATLTGHSNPIQYLRFSPQGTSLASMTDDEEVKIWNVQKSEERTSLVNADGDSRHLVHVDGGGAFPGYFLNERVLALPDSSTSVGYRTWDVMTGRPGKAATADKGRRRGGFTLSRDGKKMAVIDTTWDEKRRGLTGLRVIVTSVSNPAERDVFDLNPAAEQFPGRFVFSNDGQILAGTNGRRVWLWDLNNKREMPVTAETIDWLMFCGDELLVTKGQYEISFWDLKTGQQRRRLDLSAGHSGYAHQVAFSPNGKVLATVSDEGEVFLRDARRAGCCRCCVGIKGT